VNTMTEDKKKQEPAEAGLDLDALASRITQRIALPADIGLMVTDAVEKAIRDKGLDRVARKSLVVEGAEPSPEQTKEFLARQFVAASILHGLGAPLTDVQRKALSEGTPSAGGYLVPDSYRAELVARLPELSDLYPHVRVIPVDSDAGSMPSLATDVTITWGRAENEAITETDPAFGQVSWSIVNMSALTYLSRELVSDGNPGLIGVITELRRSRSAPTARSLRESSLQRASPPSPDAAARSPTTSSSRSSSRSRASTTGTPAGS